MFWFPSVDVVRPTGACKARRRKELISWSGSPLRGISWISWVTRIRAAQDSTHVEEEADLRRKRDDVAAIIVDSWAGSSADLPSQP